MRVRPRTTETGANPTSVLVTVGAHSTVDGHYHRLVLHAESIARTARAGQFVMLGFPPGVHPEILLPRPMAIHRRHPGRGTIEIIFSVIGRGTAALAAIAPGSTLRVMGPLGRGFEVPKDAGSVLLMAHGSGTCAVMGTAEDATRAGIAVTALLSAALRSAVVGEDDCVELGVTPIIVTEDGYPDDGTSNDTATITARLRAHFDTAPPSVIMVCGSDELVRTAVALGQYWGTPVQASTESHMACGLGFCHGCALPSAGWAEKDGLPEAGASHEHGEAPLVCRDGPVFDAYSPGQQGAAQ